MHAPIFRKLASSFGLRRTRWHLAIAWPLPVTLFMRASQLPMPSRHVGQESSGKESMARLPATSKTLPVPMAEERPPICGAFSR